MILLRLDQDAQDEFQGLYLSQVQTAMMKIREIPETNEYRDTIYQPLLMILR